MMHDSHGATEDVEIHEVVVEPTELRGSGEVHHRALRSSGALDAGSGEREGKNVVSWRLWEWNMVIEDVDHGGQRHSNVVLQVLSSPLWPRAVAAIGVVLFGVWQGVEPTEIILMVFTCLVFYFAAIFFGLQKILLTEPTNPYGTTRFYRVHRLLYVSTLVLLFVIHYFAFLIKNIRSVKYDRTYYGYCSDNTAPDFFPWFLIPFVVLSIPFTFHHLKEHGIFTWFKMHAAVFLIVNVELILIVLLQVYGRRGSRDDPWFLFVLVPWSVILILHYVLLRVDPRGWGSVSGLQINFLHFKISISADRS